MAVEMGKNQVNGADKYIEKVSCCYYKIPVKEYIFMNDVIHCE